jgi:uncharacterized protein YebE (UPF0316 family)
MDTQFFDLFAIYPALMPISIFLLRVANMALDTLRVLYTVRGRNREAWVFGFTTSLLFVVAISIVLTNLDNIWNVIAYAAGFATGNVVGIKIEARLAVGHAHVRIISSHLGTEIAESIRAAGYAATELPARGRDGTVSVINCSVSRKDIARVRAEVDKIDPSAFITVEDIRPIHRGFWKA